jgi:leader peptidase (prepilin peptidase)/N-methyltransferase
VVLEPYSKAHGVNPRVEVLREVVFLAPAIILAATAYLLVTRIDDVGHMWARMTSQAGGPLAVRFGALLAALFGYLVGGLWIWGARIGGTLAFGKEAMGMGDVHLLAAVGAVTGWVVPSIAFFVAPFLGLLWAVYLLMGRNQRQLPYGPWLAAGTLIVMLFYDRFTEFLGPIVRTMR